MKRYFRFRKDFRCNWYDILGFADTSEMKKSVNENDKQLWCYLEHYADVFIFESEGGTQEYVDKLNKTLDGLVYFVKKEDECDAIEELCDEFVIVIKGHNNMYRVFGLEKAKEYWTFMKYKGYEATLYGAIWTDKGLIYVAKMKSILPNGDIDWELL